MMSFPRFSTAVLLALALLPGAGAQSLPPSGKPVAGAPGSAGLPSGGGLDGARVIEQRYGKPASGEARPSPDTARPDAARPDAARPDVARPDAARPDVARPDVARPGRIPDALATLVAEDTGGKDGALVPLTFGQVFKPGAVGRGEQLGMALADGSTLPLQADIKARHADGSLRHVILSAVIPAPKAGKPIALGLVKARRPDTAKTGKGHDASLDALLRSGADATIEATVDGKRYTAALGRLLVQARPVLWLDGPVAREWQVAAPLAGPDGQPHPHLAARFAVRWYPALDRARVDLTVENNWAFVPGPRNFTYDVRVTVGGKEAYASKALTHYHHARWRKLFWLGGAPSVHLRHDSGQLIDSLAVPNYDRSIVVDERALARLHADWQGPRTAPMGNGLAMRSMGTTGGRPDIGLLPGWAVMYLLGMDRRAAEITLGTAEQAGSWSTHFRDERTGLPASVLDFPYMARAGTPSVDARNRATGKNEQLPACPDSDACASPLKADVAHQPAFSYLPYLLTGDHFHLEELQFWAMYNVLSSNPAYRQNRKGLFKQEQVRAQAWAMRTLGQAAYVTPDDHPLKRDFRHILESNLDWYNATYTHNREANGLGIVAKNGKDVTYDKKRGMAPWQDDFFTASMGHLAELGFGKARELLVWKAKYPVSRMTGKGSCWIQGAMYSMVVRDSPSAPFYASIGEAYRASIAPELLPLPCAGEEMAAALKLRVGEMPGYSASNVGMPSNMQPALAYAADVLGEPGRLAWRQFMARSVKPNYGTGPQFAIVPR